MKKLMENDKDIIPVTIYFRYYFNMALNKAGLGDLYMDNLRIWEEQMALGLTTWAEQPEPSRSDCHAWSASPNIEFYRIILGIESTAPSFSKIRIAPSPGDLKEASGSIPHPKGRITVSYKQDKKGTGTATVSIPQGTDGVFVWRGRQTILHAGETQEIALF